MDLDEDDNWWSYGNISAGHNLTGLQATLTQGSVITIPASAGPENCGTCSDGPMIKTTPSSSGCNSATCGPTLPSLYVEVRQHTPPPPSHPTPYPLPPTHPNNNKQQTNKKQCHPPTPTHDWQNSNPWHPIAQSEALNHLHCGGELVSFCLQH